MSEKIIIDEDECKIVLVDNFISDSLIKNLTAECETLPFSAKDFVMYGKKHKTPRKTCSLHFGEEKMTYTYSGIKEETEKATDSFQELKKKVDTYTSSKEGEEFNFALINHYKDGSNYISPHSDNEKCIVKHSTIASVSFGSERKFTLKRKRDKKKVEVNLKNGSLLLMMGKTQEKWTHQINKSKKITKERYNITFRRHY